ncbi:hypothetical protein FOYG_16929 [Fusarium oxysporum NRRL 32931]|uniref:Copper-fist domain-containing protein n=1 Tax=Fusarium oxysporum NRRL 32931 TaxID=660029 RepID=W9HGA0_FUSOX|nr:hypothetical protein FOYG_16929 [Fusarium oxysporum NRRL 32931]
MISKEEKFACESCIRGHRVAQCQHTERAAQYRNALTAAPYAPRDLFTRTANAHQHRTRPC